MVRYVVHKGSPGRTKSHEFRSAKRARQFVNRKGGCLYQVTYGAHGLVRKMKKLGCYAGR